ncbi:uncharacterized protein LOC122037347 [Zingiber officinale]|uniref:Uncharacterized protein n=1 Tax=Zingiber officinale TaxID=94328 RepID=A0A8J5CQA0_ZINOF|nr:uncharacterized protein LOC122037347 [Zingiber officinale]KAG6466840.1 hypothetical protein ZIOFF_075376 [Zingiber officinale]
MASSFPHFSGIGEDGHAAAVDAIIAEASDLCALEQIAALNTAHLSDSNLLPSHLESRFRKLKSLPNSLPDPSTALTPRFPPENGEDKENFPDPPKMNRARTLPAPTVNPQKPDGSIPREEDALPTENECITRTKKEELKSNWAFGSSPSFLADSSGESSPSPPRQRCCLCFSPKRAQRKSKGDEILSELGIPSLKEEHRKLKKALKEQEKMTRETEKIVKWVKKASARMNSASVDDLLSDAEDEELK